MRNKEARKAREEARHFEQRGREARAAGDHVLAAAAFRLASERHRRTLDILDGRA